MLKLRNIGIICLLWFLIAPSVHAANLSGRILLDVENNGEAWYVNPVNDSRYYLGRPADAYQIMRELGLGISNSDLSRFDRDRDLRRRLSGRILLQVESRGEAYYVDPQTLSKHYLGRPADAFRIMSDLGLGILESDLVAIKISGTAPLSSGSVQISGVPFVAQAPFGEWGDERQQEACEEASVYIAMKWVRGESINKTEARAEFIRVSKWEKSKWGYFQDTSAKDTVDRLIKGYYKYQNVELYYDISAEDIVDQLNLGNILIVHINGKAIGNPFYRSPGPDRHTLVVTGYDAVTNEFIVHDPGTRHGENMRFDADTLQNSLRDYNSGVYQPIGDGGTSMIVIKK